MSFAFAPAPVVRHLFTPILLVLLSLGGASACAAPDQPPRILLDTSLGQVVVELFPEAAPGSAANFLQYVDDGFYDGTIFHRVIGNFMVQTGGYDAELTYREPRNTIASEADNGLTNVRGTLAMARMNDPDSADSQFFINLKDNSHLDHQPRLNPGYTVFGKVVAGMEVVDAIADVDTGSHKGMANVPLTPVQIISASRYQGALPAP